jgi:hypothetical protein
LSSKPQNCQHQMAIQTQRHHSTPRKAHLVACGFIQIPGEDTMKLIQLLSNPPQFVYFLP